MYINIIILTIICLTKLVEYSKFKQIVYPKIGPKLELGTCYYIIIKCLIKKKKEEKNLPKNRKPCRLPKERGLGKPEEGFHLLLT